MNKEQTQIIEEIEEAQGLFDALNSYFMRHPEAPSGALLEAVDYVANYVGDIAGGREYKPDNLKEALPTAHQAGREEESKRIEKVLIECLSLELGHGGLTASGDWMFKAEVMKMIKKALTNPLEDKK